MSNTFKLRNGRILLSTEAPGGIYNSSQLKKIAALCDGDSVTVKATEDQRLALIVNPEKASLVASELKSMGLGVRHYQDGLHQPVSCIGELCESHEQDALGSALDISTELEGIKLKSPLKIGINGCAKCCVPCHTLDVSVVGDLHGYRISLGGKTSQLPEMASFAAEGIPATEIARLVRAIVEIYRNSAHDGETLQEVIDREGAGKFIEALAPWSQDASTTSDPFSEAIAAPTETIVDQTSQNAYEATPPSEGLIDDVSTETDKFPTPGNDSSPAHEKAYHDQPETIEPPIVEASLDEDEFERDISLTAEPTGSVTSEIHVHPIESDVNMDLIMDQAEESNMSDVEITEASPADIPDSNDFETTESSNFGNKISEETTDKFEMELAGPEESSEQAVTEQAVTEQAVTEQAVTEQAVTEQVVTEQVVTEQVVTEQAVTEQAVTEQAVTELTMTNEESENKESPSESAPVSREFTEGNSLIPQDEEEKIEAELIASIAAHHQMTDSDNLEAERHLSTELLAHSEIQMDQTKADKAEVSQTSEEEISGNFVQKPNELQYFEGTTIKLSRINANPSTAKLSIQAFDLDENGNPVISWSNGLILTLTHESVRAGHIRFCGHEIKITESNSGMHIEVDGMRMFLPNAA